MIAYIRKKRESAAYRKHEANLRSERNTNKGCAGDGIGVGSMRGKRAVRSVVKTVQNKVLPVTRVGDTSSRCRFTKLGKLQAVIVGKSVRFQTSHIQTIQKAILKQPELPDGTGVIPPRFLAAKKTSSYETAREISLVVDLFIANLISTLMAKGYEMICHMMTDSTDMYFRRTNFQLTLWRPTFVSPDGSEMYSFPAWWLFKARQVISKKIVAASIVLTACVTFQLPPLTLLACLWCILTDGGSENAQAYQFLKRWSTFLLFWPCVLHISDRAYQHSMHARLHYGHRVLSSVMIGFKNDFAQIELTLKKAFGSAVNLRLPPDIAKTRWYTHAECAVYFRAIQWIFYPLNGFNSMPQDKRRALFIPTSDDFQKDVDPSLRRRIEQEGVFAATFRNSTTGKWDNPTNRSIYLVLQDRKMILDLYLLELCGSVGRQLTSWIKRCGKFTFVHLAAPSTFQEMISLRSELLSISSAAETILSGTRHFIDALKYKGRFLTHA